MATASEKKLLELSSRDVESFKREEFEELLRSPDVRVNVTDNNGMTALMHAAYKGNSEACKLLLESGADINSNFHREGYTALMFATIAGHADVVELCLQAGAKTSTINNAGKTATQVGSFVGQHECVSVINNFVSLKDLEPYTAPQGLEKAPKLDPSLAHPLHRLLITTTLHPVKLLQVLGSHPSLVEHHSQVLRVLDLLCERTMKEGREAFALKVHYLAFLLQQCVTTGGRGREGLIKMLLTCREDGAAVELDKFLRQCLRQFPHIHSLLLKQMVASLANVPPGETPTALLLFQQALLGKRSLEESDSCSTCGEGGRPLKKCSKCKQVWYCGVDCQRLAWTLGNHKKLCKKWAAQVKSGGESQGLVKSGGEGQVKSGGESQGLVKSGRESQGLVKSGGESQGLMKSGGESQEQVKSGGESEGQVKSGGESQGQVKSGEESQKSVGESQGHAVVAGEGSVKDKATNGSDVPTSSRPQTES